ncbi:MAG TPA: excinuclease ABC subunit UvrC [Gemmatimonadaceae bacterium]|nr:excinuclease ABC subunit UvrC [Gemmatimonadaceae bacterium]
MPVAPDAVAQKLAHLPDTPGVYLWKAADGTVLYVGKAKRLKPRVRSYFLSDHLESPKTRLLVQQIADVETIVVPTEAHALILEANLIKEHRPRFNVTLRDDKSYPFVKVTVQEPFPRVFVTRQLLNDGARYFGPYTDVSAMRHALDTVRRVFTVRSCRYDMPREMPDRPCLDHHIGRCKAPCVFLQTEEDYRQMIDEVVAFLEGRTNDVVRRVRARMTEASEALDFERAAELRDAIAQLQRMEEPTVVLEVEGGDRDVLGYARDGDDAAVTMLRIRGGKLLARDHRFLEGVEGAGDGEVLSTYLATTYLSAPARARELLLPFDFDDRPPFEEALAGAAQVRIPQRGPKRELVDLAEQNARHLLEEFKLAGQETGERAADPVYELGRELGLEKLPRSIVCFDNSTAQGKDNVGSIVWFENGRPRRSEYRTMRVKTVDEAAGPDDFQSMREVVGRYFRRRLDERKSLPDLVVIDGGKGQLSAAATALDELGLQTLPLVSLAKREEEIFVRGRAEPLRLSRRSPALRLLQQARDEAHRTAVGYNRKRRTMRTVTSELLKIPGVGPVKRRELLRVFGSLQGVREATVEQVAALEGFSEASASKLLAALRASDATAVPQESAPDASATPEPAMEHTDAAPDVSSESGDETPPGDPPHPSPEPNPTER